MCAHNYNQYSYVNEALKCKPLVLVLLIVSCPDPLTSAALASPHHHVYSLLFTVHILTSFKTLVKLGHTLQCHIDNKYFMLQ